MDTPSNNPFNRVMHNSWIELAARWILGVVFIYAGFQKIMAPEAFAKIIYGYDLSPLFMINIIAIVLPMIEVLAGATLMMGIWPKSAALVLNLLLTGFMILISINLIRDYQFDCGCLSTDLSGEKTSPESLLFRDFILLAMGVHVFLFPRTRKLCTIPQ